MHWGCWTHQGQQAVSKNHKARSELGVSGTPIQQLCNKYGDDEFKFGNVYYISMITDRSQEIIKVPN